MFFVEYVKKQMEKTTGKTKGKCYKCIFCCIECCLACCNKIMEFINKHAYIQIALKGDSFCTAAWEGFGLIIRNLGNWYCFHTYWNFIHYCWFLHYWIFPYY